MKSQVLQRISAAVLLFLTAVFNVHAFNWPVDDPVVLSTFGSPARESFRGGIELDGQGDEVRPSENGELLYYNDINSGFSNLPSGLGSFAVIEHDRKLRTLYGGIQLSDSLKGADSLKSSDILGKITGEAGAGTAGFSFYVIDSEFEQFVNPLLLLNSIPDTIFPVIRNVSVEISGELFPVGRESVVKAGKAELLADIFDPTMAEGLSRKMAPYKIHLFLNGEEIFYICFESLLALDEGSRIMSNRDLDYSDFYKDGMLCLGEINLVPGEFRFEILASDYPGNETSRTFRLTVVE